MLVANVAEVAARMAVAFYGEGAASNLFTHGVPTSGCSAWMAVCALQLAGLGECALG